VAAYSSVGHRFWQPEGQASTLGRGQPPDDECDSSLANLVVIEGYYYGHHNETRRLLVALRSLFSRSHEQPAVHRQLVQMK